MFCHIYQIFHSVWARFCLQQLLYIDRIQLAAALYVKACYYCFLSRGHSVLWKVLSLVVSLSFPTPSHAFSFNKIISSTLVLYSVSADLNSQQKTLESTHHTVRREGNVFPELFNISQIFFFTFESYSASIEASAFLQLFYCISWLSLHSYSINNSAKRTLFCAC